MNVAVYVQTVQHQAGGALLQLSEQALHVIGERKLHKGWIQFIVNHVIILVKPGWEESVHHKLNVQQCIQVQDGTTLMLVEQGLQWWQRMQGGQPYMWGQYMDDDIPRR